MRTKTLLLAAAAIAAGVISSQAQSNVYSANIVGYYNVSIPGTKFATIANQLPVNGTNTLINETLTNGVADGSSLLLWNGIGFNTFTYFADFAVWADGDGNPATDSLGIGKAAFLLNGASSPVTITVVGQVPTGSQSVSVPNGFGFYAIPAPMGTNIDNVTYGAFPAADGDNFLHWSVALQAYDNTYTYFADFTTWADTDGNPVSPTLGVGEGFFYLHNGGTANWAYSFNP